MKLNTVYINLLYASFASAFNLDLHTAIIHQHSQRGSYFGFDLDFLRTSKGTQFVFFLFKLSNVIL